MIKEIEVIQDLRLYSKPSSDNPYFLFTNKSGDWDFAIRQALPKTVLKEDVDGQSHYFIKPLVPNVLEVFQSFKWQTKENKALLGGSKSPCLDQRCVLDFYLRYKDTL